MTRHFRGNHPAKLDERNRVALPRTFREAFGDGAVLTPGVDGCVELYTQEGYDAEAAVVERVSEHTQEGRDLRRAFYGAAFDAQRDGQGRILIPAQLLEGTSIDKEVTVVGAKGKVEIWARAEWEAKQPTLKNVRATAMENVGSTPATSSAPSADQNDGGA